MITLVPDGGLCNRMRSIAAACILARHAQRPLDVHWYRTPACNARFGDIFRTDEVPFRVTERWAMLGIVRDGLRIYESWLGHLGGRVVRREDATPDRFDLAGTVAAARRGSVHIRSFAKFLSEPDMFQVFEPVSSIQRKIHSLHPSLSDAVGVHIRRTDNKESIEKSPMSAFVKLMDAEVDRTPETRFFVATDSPAAYRELSNRYDDRVFQYEKGSLSRDDPAAIADAVIDLYALGSCRKIIGSYWSSFTNVAAQLRGIERVVARADT